MNTAMQNAYPSARPLAMVAILVASLASAAAAQEPSKPFVLKPASPASLEAVMPASASPTAVEPPLVPQPMQPGAASGAPVPGAVPGSVPTIMPQQGATLYVAPDGRVVRPTHVYRGGRVYRIAPGQSTAGAMKKKAPPLRPKIDYSLAPVQPAIRPRLLPKDDMPVVTKNRVIDGAPLLRQEAVVSADRPVTPKKKPTNNVKPSPPRNRPAVTPNTAPWLSGIRRMMDGNRSMPASPSQCPNCRKRQSSAQIASKPSSKQRK